MIERIRSATRPLHEQIEKTIDIPRWLSSRQAYAELLRATAAFYLPLEDELTQLPWSEAGYAFTAGRKSPDLIRDLNALEKPVPTRSEQCADLPRADTLAGGFGCLYVIEGASLGGQIISRLLRRDLNITPETGGAFYHGAGDRTAVRWRGFIEQMSSYCGSDEVRIAAATTRAVDCFRCFERWMAAHSPAAFIQPPLMLRAGDNS